jgi:hypothetical protein
MNDDGEPEVVVRRTKDSSLYSVNGYSLVKGKHQERHGYDTLFTNEFARKRAHEQGIKQKNYLKRMAQYDGRNLQLHPGLYNPVRKGRQERLTKGQKAKISQQKSALLQALRYFCLDLCYKAFTRAVAEAIGESWKISGKYLLSLYSKASPLFLRNLVFNLGGISGEQGDLIGPDHKRGQMSLGQFVKGNPQLVDAVWVRFISELWDGDPSQEKKHYRDFVNCVWVNYPQIKKDAVERLTTRWQDIQKMNDNMKFNEEEIGLAQVKFDREIEAFNIIDGFFQDEGHQHDIALRGITVPLFPNSDITLLPAMELRMDAQLLDVQEIRDGRVSTKPLPTPPGKSRTEITASKIAHTKTKFGIPPSEPIPEGVMAPPGAEGGTAAEKIAAAAATRVNAEEESLRKGGK